MEYKHNTKKELIRKIEALKEEIEELRGSQEELSAVLQNAPLMMILVDEQRIAHQVNHAAEKFIGRGQQEMIGKRGGEALRCLHSLDSPKGCGFGPYCEQCRVRRAVLDTSHTGKDRYQVEAILPFVKGEKKEERHLLVSTTLLSVRGEKRVLVCIEDVTKKKRAEKEYRNLVENAHEVILVVQDGVIKFANKKVEGIGGYTREELSSAPFTEFVHPADRETVRQNYFKRLKGEKVPLVYSFRVITKDGDTRWLEISAVKINWRGESATLNFLTDVTQRKKAQQELEESLTRLRKVLSGCVQVVRSTVEKKDPYTGRHQQRVADLARAIATEMGLSKDRIEGIRTAASIHDIGKIMIPAEILTKPTQLTNLEFSMIKRHPEIGYEILKDIDFSWPVAKIILQHHEKLDGSGYPRGLRGDKIILEAKILAVADVVEAMSSHRPYRPAHSLKDALAEIEKNKGRLYDARVVDTCVKIFRESKFQFK